MCRFKKLHQHTDDGSGGGAGPAVADEAVKKAAFERDSAKAEAAKARKELDELKKNLPTDEQRQKWQELEAAQAKAEEERARKAGEFDALRQQLNERHEGQIKAKDRAIEEERQRASAIDKELNDTLIGLQFAAAQSLFGAQGKTVLLPEIAQAYFAGRVGVQVDEKTKTRSVVVKDAHGAVILDPKTGAPMEFAKAMEEVIDAHPSKNSILRGSGKVGSGSSGGGIGAAADGPIDASRLTPEQRRDPKVIAALKRQLPRGGAVFGTAYEQ